MRTLLTVAALLALLVGAWLLLRGPSPAANPDPTPTHEPTPTSTTPTPARATADADTTPDRSARARRLKTGAEARDELRQRILAAAATREATTTTTPTSKPKPTTTADTPPRPTPPRPELAAPTTTPVPLQDRTGNHPYLARVLDEQFIPLVDECHALAREQNPGLTGLLNLDVEIVGDADLGGVVDSLEPSRNNEVHDPAMLECVRESLLSITLPAPDLAGRDALMLSLRLDPAQ